MGLLAVGGGFLVAEIREGRAPPAFREGGQRFGEDALRPPVGDVGTGTNAPTSPAGTPPGGRTVVGAEPAGGGPAPSPTSGAPGPTAGPQEGATTSTRAGSGEASGASRPSPSPTPSLRAPATGRYLYRLEGWEATSAPGSRREFPDTATVAVHGLREGPQGPSVTVDLTYSASHKERMVLLYGPDGVAVSFEGGRVSFFGGAVTETSQARYRPPVLRTPFPATTGHAWSGEAEAREADGGSVVRRVTYRGRVRGTQQLTVAGRTLTTLVVEWRSEFTGQERGWRRQTLWFSPELGIWVKLQDRVHAERFRFAYDKDATLTLRQLPQSAGR